MGPLNDLIVNIAETIEGEFVLPERDFFRETSGYVALRKRPSLFFSYNAGIEYPQEDVVAFERVRYTTEDGIRRLTSTKAMVAHALRFKPIADAVERRYALPIGLMTALIVLESGGVDLATHATGAFGLIGITQTLAHDFGLTTSGDVSKPIDRNYDAELTFLMKREGNTPDGRLFLNEHDERLNILANMDAVGRMLASWSCDPAVAARWPRLDPLRRAVVELPGAQASTSYFESCFEYMTLLNSSEYLQTLSAEFAHINQNRRMSDGAVVTMERWLAVHHQYYRAAYPVSQYEELPLIKTKATDALLQASRSV